MSGNNSSSRDHYYSSSSYSRHGRDLPPIRDVLQDVLERPALPGNGGYVPQASAGLPPLVSSSRHRGSSNTHATSDYPHSHGTPGSQRTRGDVYHTSHSQSSRDQYDRGQPGVQQPTYSVYRKTSDGELVHQGTSTSAVFPQRAARSDHEDPSRRCVCDKCGGRFDRPSALETHKRTHDKEKPFQCTYSGCDKSFTVRSNMRRHEKTHDAPSAFKTIDEEGDSSNPSQYHSRGSSSTTTQPSSSQKSSSQYYSSRRR